MHSRRNSRRISLLTAGAAFAVAGIVTAITACGGADSRDTDRASVASSTPPNQVSNVMDFDSTQAVIPAAPGAAAGGPNGAELFTRCAACHQASGLGVPGAYPPLAGSEWLLNNPEVPIRIVLHGLQGPITVKNTSFNNAMTPFGDQLSDAEIAAIISYERSSWGNSASKVTPEQVASARAATKSQTGPWKPDELKGLISK